jgi:hypothetical protein
MQESKQAAVIETMRRINQIWLNGQIHHLSPVIDPEIVMVFPGFSGRIQGREQFLAGFQDFCDNAKVHEFAEHDYEADVVGNTAVITFKYEMLYERSTQRFRSTGRDLWVLHNQDSKWIAVWRTMLDVHEENLQNVDGAGGENSDSTQRDAALNHHH